MARKTKAPQANQKLVLECIQPKCPNCGQSMWSDYDNDRTIRTLSGVVQLTLKVRRCPNRECESYHQVYRPEAEGKWALPGHEFGLEVIAYAGSLRYQEHRSVPQIHQALREKGVKICQRSVSNILDRYLEQVFGSFRHHQRRTTGRQKAPASMFITGSARLIAAVATRIKTFTAQDNALVDWGAWRHQRSQLDSLRQTRLQQRRFRRDPDNYLLELETKLIQSILPL